MLLWQLVRKFLLDRSPLSELTYSCSFQMQANKHLIYHQNPHYKMQLDENFNCVNNCFNCSHTFVYFVVAN